MSIGGGGGRGGIAVGGSVTGVGTISDIVGGGAGNGGTGGTVYIGNGSVGDAANSTTTVSTNGALSNAIHALSMGGKGGIGGIAVGANVSTGLALAVTLGSDGGDGGSSRMLVIA